MSESNDKISKLSMQISGLNNRFNFLQDILLNIKKDIDLLKKSRIQENYYFNITKATSNRLTKFLDNRPKDCKILDYCNTLIEKGVFRVLRTLMEHGTESAIRKIDKYLEFSKSSAASKACENRECFKNALDIYEVLKNLILKSKEFSSRYLEEMIMINDELPLTEGDEEDINQILSPLCNIIRIKILKNLSKGGKYYSELEQDMGIKAGHLLFHVNKLIENDYVAQEKKKYIITLTGLKALQIIYQLKQCFS